MATAKPLLPRVPPLCALARPTEQHRFGHCPLGLRFHGPLEPRFHGPQRRQREKRISPVLARLSLLQDSLFLLDVSSTAADVGYSSASYYTSLGLFLISVPGVWSLIKRSVKSKIVQKTFVKEGPLPPQVAGEILSFFTRNNFSVSDRAETITFEGVMVPSRGQAALLTFCTAISLLTAYFGFRISFSINPNNPVGLVLSIAIPEGGNDWFWLTLLSPLAGAYYWKRASRKEEIKVKMIVGDDGSLSEIVVRGDDEQIEQMRKELKFSEKGMVYVKGIFER